MKFFVTDAQLAALRYEIREEVVGAQQIAAQLRDTRPDPAAPFVAHLKDEVAFWRLQFLKERQRAELAIDACRVQHSGVAAVSMDLRPQGEGGAMMSHAERDQFNDPEMAALGLTEGVG